MVDSPYRPSSFSLRQFSPSHFRHSSSVSNMSDTDTLVDRDSPDSQSKERLLSKMPQGVDAVGFGGSQKKGWGFWDLMAHRPVRVLSATMFLNQ